MSRTASTPERAGRRAEPAVALRARLPDPRDRIALGGGLRVSPFCLGMTRNPDTVVRAYEAGINHFFVTADMHWPLYEATRAGLGRLLASGVARDDVVVSAVSYVAQPGFAWAPFQEVVAAIPGLGRVDVVVAGGVYAADAPSRLERLREHVARGFVGARASGATFHDRRAAARAVEKRLADWIGVRYNALHPGAELDVFPHVDARAPTVLGFKAQTGFVRPEWARAARVRVARLPDRGDAYRFALTPAAVGGQILGLSQPSEVDAFVRALARGPLGRVERARLVRLARAVAEAPAGKGAR